MSSIPRNNFSSCLLYTSRELPQRRIRDYDNLEFKQILDTLCTYVLTDDSGFFCDSYYTTQLGLKDCTLEMCIRDRIKPMIDEKYGNGTAEFFAQAFEAFYKDK